MTKRGVRLRELSRNWISCDRSYGDLYVHLRTGFASNARAAHERPRPPPKASLLPLYRRDAKQMAHRDLVATVSLWRATRAETSADRLRFPKRRLRISKVLRIYQSGMACSSAGVPITPSSCVDSAGAAGRVTRTGDTATGARRTDVTGEPRTTWPPRVAVCVIRCGFSAKIARACVQASMGGLQSGRSRVWAGCHGWRRDRGRSRGCAQ